MKKGVYGFVIVAIVILTTITVMIYHNASHRVQVSEARSTVKQAGQQVVAYWAEHGELPATLADAGIYNPSHDILLSYTTASSQGDYWCVTASTDNGVHYSTGSATTRVLESPGCL